jgi:pimeloyl-ACP methyl ester carboxylesterase
MGLGGNSQIWAPIRRELARRYQLVMYDMQGTGRSDPSPSPTTRESLLAEVDALLDHLALERVHALGYSFGTSVLINYASRRPERVEGISLVAGIYNVTPHARAFFDVQSELAASLTRSQYLKQAFLWLCSESFFERNPEFFERMIAFLERSPHGGQPWEGWKQFINAFDADYRPLLAELRVPTQIIHGSADKVSSIDQVEQAASVSPSIRLDVVPGAGHMLTWDAPEATVAALVRFLQNQRSVHDPNAAH